METFLGKICDHLIKLHPEGLSSVCVVFPSRRAGVFLDDMLITQWNKSSNANLPHPLPETFSFEEFLKEISGKIFPDSLTLAFEMYPAYHSLFPDDSFDAYYSWATTLLNDFEEAGLAMENKVELFRNLKDLRELDISIESWNQPGKQPTDFQKKYLELWDSLPGIFKSFEERLKEKGFTTPSLAMRELLQDKDGLINSLPWSKIYFAGFNGFNPVQKKLLNHLRKSGKADFLFDTDKYYLENEMQESGKFFRKLKEDWEIENFTWTDNKLGTEEKQIEIIGVAGFTSQAKAAGNILMKISGGNPDRQTAIVLPDESLLFPVLGSFPAQVNDINVTMGLPLKTTPVFSLVSGLLDLHENAARHKGTGNPASFYHKDILSILGHPFISGIDETEARELKDFIIRENLVYVEQKDLVPLLKSSLFVKMFTKIIDSTELLKNFLELFSLIRDELVKKGNESGFKASIELEYLFHFYNLSQKLLEKITFFNPGIDLKTFRQVYREILNSGTIPFSGEPLQGVQVMGMLETRALDFENVIILSANEDLFPPASDPPTFIPYNLRKAFGLQTYEDRDAIYSYHFYRLIQRAKNVFIIYNTETGKIKGKERSRFIEQLSWELCSENSNIHLKEYILSYPIHQQTILAISQEKTESILEKIRNKVHEKGISPSALNTYLHCTIKYYFNYILGLEEKEEVEESAEANTFGSVFHSVMENLYKPYEGKKISITDFDEIESRIKEVAQKQFHEIGRTRNIQFGKNRILLGVIELLAKEVLKKDRENKSLEIIGLEKEIKLEFDLGNGSAPAILKGVLDRIDRADNQLRIMDYKTGRVTSLSIKDPNFAGEKPEGKEAFQLAAYALMYKKQFPTSESIQTGIIKLREAKEGFQEITIGTSGVSELTDVELNLIEERVKNILRQLLNPEIPFTQTEDLKRCEYCSFKVICSRE